MKFRPATAGTVVPVLIRMADWLREQPVKDRTWWAKKMNELLDEAMCRDEFGTEGQADPRGDHRS